jgi:ribosome biogenesis protein BMS1
MHPLSTSFIAIQKLDDKLSHFRIAANGIIIELNQNFKIMKKLKLIGEPFKIFKNTAFVKKMFNTTLEVAKYEGAKIQTVSGIRGQIKKAIGPESPEGCFRATFEDKIKMSDIIFCKTWLQVEIPKFYNPVYSYGSTRLLKITSEVRRDRAIDPTDLKDSRYIMADEEQELKRKRDETVKMPLIIPKNISKALPFKSKAKVAKLNDYDEIDRRRRTNLLQRLDLPTIAPFKTQFMNENDKKIYSLVQRLGTINNQTRQESHDKFQVKIAQKKKQKAIRDEIVQKSLTEKKKKRFSKLQGKNKYKMKNKD